MMHSSFYVLAGVETMRYGPVVGFCAALPCERPDRPCDPDRDRHRNLCDGCKRRAAKRRQIQSWGEMLQDEGGQPLSARQKASLSGLAGLN